jgi:hypothetical protein
VGYEDLLEKEKGVSCAFIETRIFTSASGQAEVNSRG